MATPELVLGALRSVVDPDLRRDIVTLGMVRDVVVAGGKVSLRLILTTPACPFRSRLEGEVRAVLAGLPGVAGVVLAMDAQVPQMPALFERSPIPGVRNIVAVASGKGGVGKSALSVHLAVSLAEAGARVGLLDADISGPSVPTMLGLDKEGVRFAGGEEIVPLERHGLKIFSFGFVAEEGEAVLWRGPLAAKAIRQFLKQVRWGELDYLVIDTPPGTGDVHLALLQSVPLSGSVIITTPQEVALADAGRAIAMFRKLGVTVLGVVENMAGEVFGLGGGERLSQAQGVPFLGRIPLDPAVRLAGDAGTPLLRRSGDSPAGAAFRMLAERVAQEISKAALLTVR